MFPLSEPDVLRDPLPLPGFTSSMANYDLSRASSASQSVADPHSHRVRHHQAHAHHHQQQQPLPPRGTHLHHPQQQPAHRHPPLPSHYRQESMPSALGHMVSPREVESARRHRGGGSRPVLSRALFSGHASSSEATDVHSRERAVSPYSRLDAHMAHHQKSFAASGASRQRAHDHRAPPRLAHTGSLRDLDDVLDDPFHGQYHAMRGHRKSLSFPRFNLKDGDSTILSLLRHGSPPHATSSARGTQSRQPPLSPTEVRRLRQFEAALAAQHHSASRRPPLDTSHMPSFPDKAALNHSLSTGAIDFSRPGHISPPSELSSAPHMHMWRDPPLERSASSQPYVIASAAASSATHRAAAAGEPRYNASAAAARQAHQQHAAATTAAVSGSGGKSVLLSTLDQQVPPPSAHVRSASEFVAPSDVDAEFGQQSASQPVSPARTAAFLKAPNSPTDSEAAWDTFTRDLDRNLDEILGLNSENDDSDDKAAAAATTPAEVGAGGTRPRGHSRFPKSAPHAIGDMTPATAAYIMGGASATTPPPPASSKKVTATPPSAGAASKVFPHQDDGFQVCLDPLLISEVVRMHRQQMHAQDLARKQHSSTANSSSTTSPNSSPNSSMTPTPIGTPPPPSQSAPTNGVGVTELSSNGICGSVFGRRISLDEIEVTTFSPPDCRRLTPEVSTDRSLSLLATEPRTRFSPRKVEHLGWFVTSSSSAAGAASASASGVAGGAGAGLSSCLVEYLMNLNMPDAVIVQIDVSPELASQDLSPSKRTRVSVYKAFGPEVTQVPFEYQLSG